MAELISEIWQGLRDAGLPEVMLYLHDNSASRCHWDETTMIGDVRVALLADQDRKIVRILPVDSCAGIGIASPKGVDPSGYKGTVKNKLRKQFGGECEEEAPINEEPPVQETPRAVAAAPIPAPVPVPMVAARVDPLSSRFGVIMKAPTSNARPSPASQLPH